MAASTWSEVFISHRGIEMKLGFANCLHHFLKDRGITSFLDMESLTEGNDVREDFTEAVRKAIIQVPIFTVEFGTSEWCLEELAEMMDSKRDRRSAVFPVYFNLEPEELREEEGTFGERFKAFLQDEERIGPWQNRIGRWKSALEEASWLMGFRLKTYGGAQGALMSDLATAISREISRRRSVDTMSGLVGLDDKVQKVLELLWLQDTARVCGVLIWGMSGVGKTTLANAIRRQPSLEGFKVCFIPNFRVLLPIEIQNRLLADLLRCEKGIDIGDGKSCLRDGLKQMKVFIILDDIIDFNSMEQILDMKVLCPGSRLLLTSRNRGGLPDTVLSCESYELPMMTGREAHQLFCLNAFRSTYPKLGFENRVMEMVEACAGLPLVLELLGQYVSTLEMEKESQWCEALQKLKDCKHKSISEKLKISISDLDDDEQQMFQDVSCFFVGESVCTVKRFWHATVKSCETGLLKLQRLCLVKVDENMCLTMHDLLRDLGREIGREKKMVSGRRKMMEIRDDEKLQQLLRDQKDRKKIRGIYTSLSCLQVRDLADMTSLQLLFLNGTELDFGNQQLTLPDLKWLKWKGCPHSTFPGYLSMKNCIILQLQCVNASRSTVQLPLSFAQLKKLRELTIDACGGLEGLPESFGSLERLEILGVSGLESMVEFPSSFGQLKKLRELRICQCSRLERLPESLGLLECLEVLDVRWLTSIIELPSSFGQLKNLRELRILQCDRLERLLETFGSLECLETLGVSGLEWIVELPSSFGQLKKLRELRICQCRRLERLPESFGSLECLEVLEMSGLILIVKLPSSFRQLKKLRELRICQCYWLERLPESFGSLECLEVFEISGLIRIVKLPSSFGQLKKLRELRILQCDRLEGLPESFGSLECLEVLKMSWLTSIVQLPSSFGQLKKLRKLRILQCGRLKWLPESFSSLECLEDLEMSWLTSIVDLPSSFGHLKKLGQLKIHACGLKWLPESFGSLECLKGFCAVKLASIVGLPSSFGQLKKLRELTIYACRNLKWLPESFGSLECLEVLRVCGLASINELPSSFGQLKKLRVLTMVECGSLKQLPESFGYLECLEMLRLSDLASIVKLPSTFGQLRKLRKLSISRCYGLKLRLKNSGSIDCLEVEWDGRIYQLPSLEGLGSFDCVEIEDERVFTSSRRSKALALINCVEIGDESVLRACCFSQIVEGVARW